MLMHSNDREDIKEAFAGDIVAIAGLKGATTGETICDPNNPIVLELGCGKGEYTLYLSELNPEINYIGIDIKGARIWRGAKTAFEKGIKNVAYVRSQIELITSLFSSR